MLCKTFYILYDTYLCLKWKCNLISDDIGDDDDNVYFDTC